MNHCFNAGAHGVPLPLPKAFYVAPGCAGEAELRRFLALCGAELAAAPGADAATVEAVCVRSRALLYMESARRVTEEGFHITAEQPAAGGVRLRIEYAGLAGLWYAASALAFCAAQGRLPASDLRGCPKFENRGFLEGFYGTPWQPEQRRGMLHLLARHGMNCYFYAPKDDPYHRDRWEERYDPASLARLRELIAFAGERQVAFWYCLAPGLDIRYSDPAQFDRLVAKLRQVYDAGARHFGLLLDDIPEELIHQEDVTSYGETLNAHIDLVRRVLAALEATDPANRLIVCPMQYHGRGDEYYIARLGQETPAAAELFWTGPNICSQELRTEDAMRFCLHTRHQPFYWDNYPVNDAEMFHEMHLGPLAGREPDLYRHCRGVAFNGMEYFECSKAPLLTGAAFLWDPEGYDPEAAWLAALEELLGAEGARRFLPFGEQLFTSCLRQQNGPRMMAALEAAQTAHRAGDLGEALRILQQLAAQMDDCRAFLAQSDHPMLAELQKWIKKYNQCCALLHLAIECLQAPGDAALHRTLAEKMEIYNETAAVLTEFGFRAFIDKVLGLN
ncbi:MAG: beta-N-acetylglucosaminidase domain-containing protein [Oscillospiraceae bacterium]|jgi:hyaluronoglucosaminidase|nr:beta-N-acetylglucosaminidase domain-containing protein [Oscillospiraceae bacterium]